MATTFAKALAARGISPADLSTVEARAQNDGCGLDTALLALGLLGEPQVIELVTELSALPRPPRDLVAQLSPAAAPLFPQPLAERHGMVPLGLSRRQLQLMVRHPVDLAQVDEIGFLLSRPIKLYVGTEIEVAEAMKEVYGIAVPPRLQELRKKIGAAPALPVPAPLPPPPIAPDPQRSAPTLPPLPLEVSPLAPVAPPAQPPAPEASAPTPVSASPPSAPSPESSASTSEVPPHERPTMRIMVPPELRSEDPGKGREAGVEAAAALAPTVAPVPVAIPPTSEDPNSKEFWADAGDLLTQTPHPPAPSPTPAKTTPEIPAPAPAAMPAPVPVAVPLATPIEEPSAFEAGPIEVAPPPAVEVAQPLTSGAAGRVTIERRISATEAMATLREQKSRDGVIGTAISYLRGAFDFVAIFSRKGEAFQIFEASGVDYTGGADLARTVTEIARSRVLRTIVDGRAPYVGSVPAGDPLESALGAVGRARLRAVLLYPVVIRDRTVAIVHGDRGGEALAPRQLSDVALVLSQLGPQLERVIRERRKAQPLAPVAVRSLTPIDPPRWDDRTPTADFVPPTGPVVPREPPVTDGDAVALQAASVAVEQEPFEVPIDWVDVDEGSSFGDQVRAFLSGDPPARAKAGEILRSGGADAAWALSERFPGPLFVFRTTIDELPGADGIGPVLGLMAAIGEEAVPALIQLADAQSEERRFWATVLLARFGDKRAIDVLARRLLDGSPDIALAARRGLFRLRQAPEFAPVLDQLTSELGTTTNPERLSALIRALGQFHHVAAIPRLIPLVGIRDPQISRSAAEALRELTRQDFGTAERRWSTWWNEAKEKSRLLWLIEALESRDRDLRLAAISELTEFAGLDFGYRSDIEPRKQETALHKWREWWEREGRNRADARPAASV